MGYFKNIVAILAICNTHTPILQSLTFVFLSASVCLCLPVCLSVCSLCD